MIEISVKDDIQKVLRSLKTFDTKQVSFATARALTRTAAQLRRELNAETEKVFDRPTAFTKRSFVFKPATRDNLVAIVHAQERQAKYLKASIYGGARRQKGFEKRLGEEMEGRRVVTPGAALRSGAVAGIRLNQSGNISQAQLLRVVKDLNSAGTARRFFSGIPKGKNGPAGVWARVDNNKRIVPVLVFANAAVYEKRFKLSAIGRKVVTERFERELFASLEQALRTAR